MNELDGVRLNRDSFSFREIIGQRNEWAPRSTVRTVTASSNVNPLDGLVRVDATAGAVTMTLETAVGCSGRIHRFKKIDASANAMIVDGASSETLDGAANKSTTAQYDVITAISNGVNWDLLLGNVVAGASGTVTSVGFTDTNDDTQTASGGPIVGSGTLDIAAVDAGSDKLVGWDESSGKKIYFDLDSSLKITSTTLAVGIQPYHVHIQWNGLLTSSLRLCTVKFPIEVVFPSGLSPSAGVARTAATAQTDLDIQKNGGSVGTVRWAAAGTSATFIMASQTTYAAGDILEVFGPASPDATLANIGVTLAGTRGN